VYYWCIKLFFIELTFWSKVRKTQNTSFKVCFWCSYFHSQLCHTICNLINVCC